MLPEQPKYLTDRYLQGVMGMRLRRAAEEEKSFARHFAKELREKGVEENKIVLFVEAVERIMRPYHHKLLSQNDADKIKSLVNAKLRRANG